MSVLHSPKNDLKLCIKAEPVTFEADVSVYVWLKPDPFVRHIYFLTEGERQVDPPAPFSPQVITCDRQGDRQKRTAGGQFPGKYYLGQGWRCFCPTLICSELGQLLVKDCSVSVVRECRKSLLSGIGARIFRRLNIVHSIHYGPDKCVQKPDRYRCICSCRDRLRFFMLRFRLFLGQCVTIIPQKIITLN